MVSGLQYRREAVASFYAALASEKTLDWSLALVRDPTNTHDVNAIKVVGIWRTRRARWFFGPTEHQHREQLGFVPAEYAAELARAHPEMPIAAELYEIAVLDPDEELESGLGIIIKIIVLIPSSTDPTWGQSVRDLIGTAAKVLD